ncbi:hypothetical protein PGTUg99_028480 [Puccinia graminis f. sp. tritici]|uniref:Uncharacterized protein n=1 Tax=Puccinia graminis f. sp. tritici TaxID=56615 RepID=A0A5B0SJD7_PUCGR|nr:hypothetical protein PGTUg99_028480 [Puccinia graminis f. sp. tritici]
MSIMDSHPHPSLARGNAAGSNLFDHEANTKPVIVNASAASSSVENASQSPSASHSHQHHHHHPNHPHHQFVDSSPVYHHPFRTITPNSAESNSKILDPQPQSKSSTPTNQQQTQSRPNSGMCSVVLIYFWRSINLSPCFISWVRDERVDPAIMSWENN